MVRIGGGEKVSEAADKVERGYGDEGFWLIAKPWR